MAIKKKNTKFNIIKHSFGFTISLLQKVYVEMDVREWHLAPDLNYFWREDYEIISFDFLCFSINHTKWKRGR